MMRPPQIHPDKFEPAWDGKRRDHIAHKGEKLVNIFQWATRHRGIEECDSCGLWSQIRFMNSVIIGMICTTDKAATVTGNWYGWLEDDN